MSFWDGLGEAIDDIRHKVVEEPWYGREVTGELEWRGAGEPSVAVSAEPVRVEGLDGEILPPEPMTGSFNPPTALYAPPQAGEVSKWDALSYEPGVIEVEPPAPEQEMER